MAEGPPPADPGSDPPDRDEPGSPVEPEGEREEESEATAETDGENRDGSESTGTRPDGKPMEQEATTAETDTESGDESATTDETADEGSSASQGADGMQFGGSSTDADEASEDAEPSSAETDDEPVAESTGPPVVLVVDDDTELADLYATSLESTYEVRTAYDGQSAVEAIDDSVDVVLLDRRMPGMSGDEVLEAIRSREVDCGVVMLTAVGPDLDLLEMDFDEYAVKPVTLPELEETVSRIVSLQKDGVEESQRYYALVSKRFALESRLGRGVLYDNEAYQELVEEIDQRREQLDKDVASRLETQASKAVFSARDGRSSAKDGSTTE